MNNLIETSINFNNKLYKKAIEKYYYNPRSKVNTYKGYIEYRRSGGYRNYYGKSKSNINYYRTILIELDSIKYSKKKKNPRSKSNKNTKTYYSYSKLSYFVREYYLKNIV